MAKVATSVANKPAWIDLSSSNPEASRAFYSKVFGWQVEVNPDPQYGGYAMATIDGKDVAGIGPQMTPGAPTAWMFYAGADDVEALAQKVQAAGGKVVSPPMQVGDQGKMAIFQDPSGAYLGAWQPAGMSSFQTRLPNSFAWAELNARGIDRALGFYEAVLGWTHRTSPMGDGQPDYTEFLLNGQSIAGGWEMSATAPPQTPSHWMVYFGVDDVDAAFLRAVSAGGHEMLAPQSYPGGRFAIVGDPQGAAFGLLKANPG
jgi:predicted enzyme related to lactoylglutathione lyase